MRDKDGVRVFKKVMKNKSTEKDESTPASREEVDVYHFTKVTNVALLLFNFFCCQDLAACRVFGICFQRMSSSRDIKSSLFSIRFFLSTFLYLHFRTYFSFL